MIMDNWPFGWCKCWRWKNKYEPVFVWMAKSQLFRWFRRSILFGHNVDWVRVKEVSPLLASLANWKKEERESCIETPGKTKRAHIFSSIHPRSDRTLTRSSLLLFRAASVQSLLACPWGWRSASTYILGLAMGLQGGLHLNTISLADCITFASSSLKKLVYLPTTYFIYYDPLNVYM